MSHQPPERTAVPTAPAHVPYAVISPPPAAPAVGASALTSDGNVVRVRPWRASTDVLAVAARVLLGASVVANVVVAVIDLRARQLLEDRDLPHLVGLAESAGWLPQVGTVLLIPTAVVFLVWFHRVWTSERSAHNVYTRGAGLAVGGWLIPVANLFLGASALRDLWHGTERASQGVFDGAVQRSTPRLVTAWWVAWCCMFLGTVASMLARSGARTASSLDDYLATMRATLAFDVFAAAASAFAGVLLVLVIGRLSAFARR